VTLTLHEVRPASADLGGLLLDFDGTIADTENSHRLAYNRAFAEFGLDWNWTAELYADLLGVAGGKERLHYYLAGYRPDSLAAALRDGLIEELHRVKSRHFAAIASTIPLRTGIRRLMHEAKAGGVRIAVVTTASRSGVEALLSQDPALLPMIDLIAGGEAVERKKPAPDIYQWALARLDLAPDECIAIEDSNIGLRSASGADVATLVTVSTFTSEHDFGGAAAVVSDLGDDDRHARSICGPSPPNGIVDLAFLRDLRASRRGE